MLIRIVDDDEDLAESLKFLLEPEGWKVVSYLSAEDYLKSDAPSVEGCLLLDIRMPGLSGLELQEKMKDVNFQRFPTLDAKKLVNAPKMSAHHRGICHF